MRQDIEASDWFQHVCDTSQYLHGNRVYGSYAHFCAYMAMYMHFKNNEQCAACPLSHDIFPNSQATQDVGLVWHVENSKL